MNHISREKNNPHKKQHKDDKNQTFERTKE